MDIQNINSIDNIIDTVICGHALDTMYSISDNIFQTCITSPPYWGLRDYGLDPVVWDGDAECEHEWGEENIMSQNGGTAKSAVTSHKSDRTHYYSSSQFCIHCGAWLGCLGLEPTPELYVAHLVQVFAEVKRVLRDDGTLWLNIGDSYASRLEGHGGFGDWKTGGTPRPPAGTVSTIKRSRREIGLKPKDMVLVPFRLALALQADGWWVRSDIIWHKPNCMPSSVKDRPTTDFEHVFLLAKSKKYYYDQEAIREPYTAPLNRWGGPSIKEETPKHSKYLDMQNVGASSAMRAGRNIRPNESGRNKRTVWTVPTKSYNGAHFATFPPKLIEPMILAGSKEGDIVFDPFAGSGTTLAEAKRHGRHYCGIEANPEYVKLIEKRIVETPKAQLMLDFM